MTTQDSVRLSSVVGCRQVWSMEERVGVAIAVALSAACWAMHPAAVWPAEQYKAGEAVEVFFLGKWHPAVVVDTNRRGDVLAEFEFAGQPRRQAFRKTELRFPFEAGALVRAREWSDASGQFRTRAALLSMDGESVTLRRPDMTELKVCRWASSAPWIRPSSNACKRRRGRRRESSAAVLSRRKFADAPAFGASAVKSTAPVSARRLEPDAVPGFLKLKQGEPPFPRRTFSTASAQSCRSAARMPGFWPPWKTERKQTVAHADPLGRR